MPLVDRIVGTFSQDNAATAAWSTHGPAIVAVVLVIAIAAQLADFSWRVLTPAIAPATDSPGMPLPTAATVDLPAIINAHLFGMAAPDGGDPSTAATVNSSLVLAGTLAGNDPEKGWAIIGPNAQGGRVYATGATLPGGARLFEVYTDRAILLRAGLREVLLLPRLTGGAGSAPVVYNQGSAVTNSLADGVRELIAQDPSVISEVLRPQPVFSGGQQRGYRLYPGRNRAQFAKLGLQAGDLVTAINGTPLDDPNRGLESLRNIGVGGSVMLTLERNGQSQQLTVDSSNVLPDPQPSSEPPPAAAPPVVSE